MVIVLALKVTRCSRSWDQRLSNQQNEQLHQIIKYKEDDIC